MGLEGAKSGAFILRFIEMITAIVAFSTVVDYDASSRIKFVMFTGITGFVLAFFFMVAYVAGVRAARGMIALILDVIWLIFWLTAAACASAVLSDGYIDSSIGIPEGRSKWRSQAPPPQKPSQQRLLPATLFR